VNSISEKIGDKKSHWTVPLNKRRKEVQFSRKKNTRATWNFISGDWLFNENLDEGSVWLGILS
jgi:hypothetical protein